LAFTYYWYYDHIMIIISWLYRKIDLAIAWVFRLIGFTPENNVFLWETLAIFTFLMILYLLGWLVKTRLANVFEYIFCKIPGYNTIKGLVGIFNSSKKGQNQVLVVAIKGFAKEGYNIGLMYSQKESIIKDQLRFLCHLYQMVDSCLKYIKIKYWS